jgi:hypothetical protein
MPMLTISAGSLCVVTQYRLDMACQFSLGEAEVFSYSIFYTFEVPSREYGTLTRRREGQISGHVLYNGHHLKEFVPQRIAAYISQVIHLKQERLSALSDMCCARFNLGQA